MESIERILDELETFPGKTPDDLTMAYLLGMPQDCIGRIEHEASGPDRSQLIAARALKDLRERPVDPEHPEHLLVQLVSSSSKPLLMREQVAIFKILSPQIAARYTERGLRYHQAEHLGDRLKIRVLIWSETPNR